MIRVNLSPKVRCDSGPTTGCHESGELTRIFYDGRHVETRVLCLCHARRVASWYGAGFTFQA